MIYGMCLFVCIFLILVICFLIMLNRDVFVFCLFLEDCMFKLWINIINKIDNNVNMVMMIVIGIFIVNINLSMLVSNIKFLII